MGLLDHESREDLRYLDILRIHDENFSTPEDEERFATELLAHEDMSHWKGLLRVLSEKYPHNHGMIISGIVLYLAAEKSRRELQEIDKLIETQDSQNYSKPV